MAKLIVYLALCVCCGAMGMLLGPQMAAATVVHSETNGICGGSRFFDDLSQVSVQIGEKTLAKYDMMQPLYENPLMLFAKNTINLKI